MAYLISHLWVWLLLTAAFMALTGWAFHAMRSQAKDENIERERTRLMRELIQIAPSGETGGVLEYERENDTLRRRAELDAARFAEMERALAAARTQAEANQDAGALVQSAAEISRLKIRIAELEAAAAAANDAPEEEDAAVKAWRLRYFEQRVRYLEARSPAPAAPAPVAAPAPAPAPTPAPAPAPLALAPDLSSQWRARYFAARTAYLEDQLRAAPPAQTPPPAQAEPSAADIEAGRRIAWRMRYLARRVAYLQQAGPAVTEMQVNEETERLKWRVRYLEARVRHFERAPAPQAPALQVITAPAPQAAAKPDIAAEEALVAPQAPLVPIGEEERPPSLPAARGGAPDDFTLIDGVTQLQQSTLNSLGIYHFDQIAAWTPAHIAWVDQYLRLRGRIVDEEWVAQAEALSRGVGVALSERLLEDEAV